MISIARWLLTPLSSELSAVPSDGAGRSSCSLNFWSSINVSFQYTGGLFRTPGTRVIVAVFRRRSPTASITKASAALFHALGVGFAPLVSLYPIPFGLMLARITTAAPRRLFGFRSLFLVALDLAADIRRGGPFSA